MARAKIEGLEAWKALLVQIPAEMHAGVEGALDKSADELVGAIKALAPENDLDPHAGALRDSVHKEAPHQMARLVVADAKDAEGKYYGKHVEHGHRTKGGGHVPAHPFFFPAYRAIGRKRLVNRIKYQLRKAAKLKAAGA